MAKKTTKKKEIHKKVVHHTKRLLAMTITVPVVIVILVLVLALYKVPYQAKERYTEIQTYTEEISSVQPDYDNPVQERVCVDIPADVRIEQEFPPFITPFGLDGYICKVNFRVWNNADSDGKWAFKYIFNIGGKEVETAPITKNIAKLSSAYFEFTSDECEKGDSLTGEYVLVEGPTVPDCEYITSYPDKTVVSTVTKERSVPMERTITKYEPLWQKILGYNSFEKI